MDDRASARKAKRDALTPSQCEIPGCDWTYSFQRHRITPGREGGKYKAPNVIALCPNHHSLADDGVLSREYLSDIVRIRVRDAASEESIDPTTEPGTPDSAEERDSSSEESGEGPGERSTDAGDGIAEGLA